MGADQNFDWRKLTQSALDWWREAGVDTLVDEQPRDWLAAAVAPAFAAPIAPALRMATLPDTLEAFAAWRTGPDAPEAGWPGGRLSPQGHASAPLWIFTDLPEREDLKAECLLSGAQGRLLERMLAAIGLSRDGVFVVPLAIARPPAGRIGREVEPRLAEVARHHLSLGRPVRALLLGETTSRALLGINCHQARGSVHRINHTSGPAGVEAATMIVASLHPRLLLERPFAKADAWRDLRLLGSE